MKTEEIANKLKESGPFYVKITSMPTDETVEKGYIIKLMNVKDDFYSDDEKGYEFSYQLTPYFYDHNISIDPFLWTNNKSFYDHVAKGKNPKKEIISDKLYSMNHDDCMEIYPYDDIIDDQLNVISKYFKMKFQSLDETNLGILISILSESDIKNELNSFKEFLSKKI